MVIDENKGKWYTEEVYKDISYLKGKITEIDDMAYYLYTRTRPSKSCVPQVTFIYNYREYKHQLFVPYYIMSERVLKMNKIKNGHIKKQ